MPTLRTRLGGRWAISWQSTVLGTALVIVLATATGGGLGITDVFWRDLPGWFFAAFLAGVAIVIYIGIANVTVFRNRRAHPLPVWVAVVFHGGIGLIFGVVFLAIAGALGLATGERGYQAVVGYVLAGLWFCLTMSLYLEARDRYLRERRALLEEAVVLELSQLHESRIIERLRAAVPNAQALTVETSSILPLNAWWSWSSELREADSDTLERKVRRSAQEYFPSPGPRALLSQLWTDGTLAPISTAVIVAIAYYRSAFGAWGLWQGLATVALVCVVVALLLAGANRFTTSGPMRLTLGLTLVIGASVLLLLPALTSMGAAPAFGLGFALVVASAVFVVLPAGRRSLEAAYASTNANLRRHMDQRRVEQAEIARELAQAATRAATESPVNASAQPAVLACAAGLHKAANSGSSIRLRSALEWSVAVLEGDVGDEQRETLAQTLGDVTAPWLGLVQVTLHTDPETGRMTGALTKGCRVLVEEGLALACGRSAADEVRVVVSRCEGQSDTDKAMVSVEIFHDGMPLGPLDLPDDSRLQADPNGDRLFALVYADSFDPA